MQYDYGAKQNLKLYNSTHPPEYKLNRIQSPIALYYGINDRLMNIQVTIKLAFGTIFINYLYIYVNIKIIYILQTADMLAKRLPNLIKNYAIPDPSYSHIDFVFGLNSRELFFDDIVAIFKKLS
jgi:hypothetical protein